MSIDLHLLRQSIRQNLDMEHLLILLDRAVELIPQDKLPQLIEGVLNPELLQVDEIPDELLLEEVLDFQVDSLAGVYYESFRVNSRNFMDKSRGTINWIAEFHRLMNRCVAECQDGEYFQTQPAFEILFELLDEIDEYYDNIIFFADEAGSWQVGVDWAKVLPAYFTALAEIAKPQVYAQSVVKVVTAHANYERDIHLKTAMKIAKPSQCKALKALI
ncbi:hypothetical protein Lepto7375DRAFT_5664 [Leptolyngbya sp. PCC 7375]|nr:hypothetical protein Lepto7375DRAFT_5664 [Leptolyngbya sp. PCC 7375]